MDELKRNLLVKVATEHHTNLNTYHAVITLMEGGLLYGQPSVAARQIIALAKKQSAKELDAYDKARAAAAAAYVEVSRNQRPTDK